MLYLIQLFSKILFMGGNMKNIKITKALKDRVLNSFYQTKTNYSFIIKCHGAFGRTSQEVAEKLLVDIKTWANNYGVAIEVVKNTYILPYVKPSEGFIEIIVRDGEMVEMLNSIVNSKLNPFHTLPKREVRVGIRSQ